MSRIFFYKLTSDNGGAPCIQDGILSLAICKPMIRCSAVPGDLIFGFAADSLHSDNRLIYIARVAEKITNGDYYTKRKYTARADCVYRRHGSRFKWKRGAMHHGPEHLRHDLGVWPDYPRAVVLLSRDFRYFGRDGTDAYKIRYPHMKAAVEGLGIGYRINHADKLRAELISLKRKLWNRNRKKVVGVPSSMARCRTSHRGRSCGVIGE